MKKVNFLDLGLVAYKGAWDLQEVLFKKIVDSKLDDRLNDTSTITQNYLIFCEHTSVYTLGKSGKQENLLLS